MTNAAGNQKQMVTVRTKVFGVIAIFALMSSPAKLPAQAGGIYDLSWSTIDSGGSLLEGGPYRLAGSIGQPDAVAVAPAGGVFELVPGFLQDSTFFPVPVALSVFSLD